MPAELFDPRPRRLPYRVAVVALDLLCLGPLRRLHLYQYAAVATLLFGLWQLGLGLTVLWLAQQETPDKPLADANGPAPGAVNLAAGIALGILAGFLFCRKDWARKLAIVVTAWLTIVFLHLALEAPPLGPGFRRWLAVKVAGAALWWVPALLTLLLINDRVRADFS
jgi:hypothetical protein